MAKRCSLKIRKNFEIHCERKLKDRQFCPSFSQKSKRGGSNDICTRTRTPRYQKDILGTWHEDGGEVVDASSDVVMR